ncbi:hypothetical protein NFI96_026921, partial [Prochilodus magdalenae]
MAASTGNETMPAEGASTQTVTGGAKPLHRFLRVEPKAVGVSVTAVLRMIHPPHSTCSVGVLTAEEQGSKVLIKSRTITALGNVQIVLMYMGSCLFMFGVPMKMDVLDNSTDLYSSFWLGILYFTCGVLYVLAEREPTKKIITASLALSIISTLGTIFAAVNFIKGLVPIYGPHYGFNFEDHNYTSMPQEEIAAEQHYMAIYSLEAVFLFNSLLGGVILITMTVFARMALRSTRTQVNHSAFLLQALLSLLTTPAP